MSAQKLNIGWEICRVFDDNDVRCFKWQRINHLTSKCKNHEIYVKCHGCDKKSITKCICNCMRINRKLNMDLDENHGIFSKECAVLQNKLKMIKRRIELNI